MYKDIRMLRNASLAQMQADQLYKAQVKPNKYVERVRTKNHLSIYGLVEWRIDHFLTNSI